MTLNEWGDWRGFYAPGDNYGHGLPYQAGLGKIMEGKVLGAVTKPVSDVRHFPKKFWWSIFLPTSWKEPKQGLMLLRLCVSPEINRRAAHLLPFVFFSASRSLDANTNALEIWLYASSYFHNCISPKRSAHISQARGISVSESHTEAAHCGVPEKCFSRELLLLERIVRYCCKQRQEDARKGMNKAGCFEPSDLYIL